MFRNPSLNWEKLQDVFYRNREIYDLKWPQSSNYEGAFATNTIGIQSINHIHAYSYSGECLKSIRKDQFGDIIKIDFDEHEQLIVVTSRSLHIIKAFTPLKLKTINLDDSVNDTIWDYRKGYVILKNSQDIYSIQRSSFDLVFKNDGTFTLLTRLHWDCNSSKIILLDVNHLFEFNTTKKSLTKIKSNSQWHRVIISSDNFVCLFNAKFNKLQIFRNISTVLLEHELDSLPIQIKWCGNDCIACSFEDEIRLFGPDGSYITFWYSDQILDIHSEIDVLKVFTYNKVYIISRVQQCTSNVFRVGSTESAAILLDSLDLLEDHAPKAIENLRNIDLKKAVLDCINSATDEIDVILQKRLLKAASFGKATFSSGDFAPDTFVDACSLIKILNVLRGQGFYLTVEQYQRITMKGIISMLLIRHKYYECFEICKLINDFSDYPRIFSAWAIAKITLSPDLDDNELLTIIENQKRGLKNSEQISMVNIAHTAYLEGRFHLARDLTLLETRPELKMMELLELDDDNLALSEALKTEEPDLIVSLLLKCRSKLSRAQFIKLLILGMTDNQVYSYFQYSNDEFLYDFYRQTDNYVDLAHLIVRQSRQQGTIKPFLQQIHDLYGRQQNNNYFKKEVDLFHRQEELWKYQDNLSDNYNRNFTDITLESTLIMLIEMQHDKQVTDFVKRFKVSEKRLYHCKCKVLVDNKRFDELHQFANEKKSPIGYLPFYKYLIKMGYETEASLYVGMMSGISYEQKKDMYLKCKNYQEAIRLAERERDIESLQDIYKLIPADKVQLRSLIDEIFSRL